MELKIFSPKEGGFIKEIEWNNEELKQEIAAKMQDYKTLVYTEDKIKEAKADRAALNKLIKAIEDEHKRIKKLCMVPVDQFGTQVKEIVALIQEPVQLIDSQIKEVENQKKVEKKVEILEFYEKSIGTLKGILPFDKVFKQEYLNASRTMKSIRKEISERIEAVNTDLDTIEGFGSKYELQIKDVYLRTLDLSAAIREKSRLEEIERQLEERRQKEEQARKAGELKEKEQLPDAAPPYREAEKPKETEAYPSQMEDSEEGQALPEANQPAEEIHILDFRITGTKQEVMAVKKFLDDNKIKYGPVPKEGGNQ